jgi:nitrogenase molybdenum-iron protein beta chain
MTTVTALPRGIPILHAAQGCAGNTAWTLLGGGGLQVGGYCGALSVGSTNIQEREVVFGGGDKLRTQIENSLKVLDGDIYAVLCGCVPAMIGDDIQAVVSGFAGAGKPVIWAGTAGFKGPSRLGYDIVLEALAKQFVKKSARKHRNKVNLLGIVPNWDVFWRGNIEGVRKLLELLDLEVCSFFSGGDSAGSIERSAEAALNVVVSAAHGAGAAAAYEERHGVPSLFLPMPVGPSASGDFLRKIAEALDIPGERAGKIIAAEEESYYRYIDTLADCYSDLDLQRHAVIIGDANYAAALPRFLADDLGWLPELTVCADDIDQAARERVTAAVGAIDTELRPDIVFDTDVSRVPEWLAARRPATPAAGKYTNTLTPAFLIGSSLDRELAASLGAAHLSVSFPVSNRAVLDRGYTGYTGGLRLTEDLFSAIVAAR